MSAEDSDQPPSGESRLASLGILSVYLRSASGLLAADLNGFSDPYVKCHCNQSMQRTHVVRKTLNPVWQCKLDFGCKLGDVVQDGLKLELLDHDNFNADDPLGEVAVNLAPLAEVDDWHFTESLPTQGVIEFTVSWRALPTRVLSSGVLKVKLLRATGLMAADSNGCVSTRALTCTPTRTPTPPPTPPPAPPPAPPTASLRTRQAVGPLREALAGRDEVQVEGDQ